MLRLERWVRAHCRRGKERSCTLNIVPTTESGAIAPTAALPELGKRLDSPIVGHVAEILQTGGGKLSPTPATPVKRGSTTGRARSEDAQSVRYLELSFGDLHRRQWTFRTRVHRPSKLGAPLMGRWSLSGTPSTVPTGCTGQGWRPSPFGAHDGRVIAYPCRDSRKEVSQGYLSAGRPADRLAGTRCRGFARQCSAYCGAG